MEVKVFKGPMYDRIEKEIHRQIAALIHKQIKEEKNERHPVAKWGPEAKGTQNTGGS